VTEKREDCERLLSVMRQVPEAIREGKRWIWFKWGYNIVLVDKKLCKVHRVIWDVSEKISAETITIYEIPLPIEIGGYSPQFSELEFLFGSHWMVVLEKSRKLEEDEKREIIASLKKDLGIDL